MLLTSDLSADPGHGMPRRSLDDNNLLVRRRPLPLAKLDTSAIDDGDHSLPVYVFGYDQYAAAQRLARQTRRMVIYVEVRHEGLPADVAAARASNNIQYCRLFDRSMLELCYDRPGSIIVLAALQELLDLDLFKYFLSLQSGRAVSLHIMDYFCETNSLRTLSLIESVLEYPLLRPLDHAFALLSQYDFAPEASEQLGLALYTDLLYQVPSLQSLPPITTLSKARQLNKNPKLHAAALLGLMRYLRTAELTVVQVCLRNG